MNPGEDGAPDQIEWERGENRKIAVNDLINLTRVTCEDEWCKRKFTIKLLEDNEENINRYTMYLYSDLFPHTSQCTVFKKMKLMIQRVFDKMQPVWKCSFFIDVDVTHFYYTYAIFYRKDRRVFIDRDRFREVVLNQAIPDNRNLPGKGLFIAKPQGFYKIDKKINTEMTINRIDSTIWFGNYPQCSDDFRQLFEREIKVVINLMTNDEVNDSCLDVASQRKESQKHNITFIRMEYDNSLSFAERSETLQSIVFKLHQLLLKNDPVYICDMYGVDKVKEILADLFEEHLTSRSSLLKSHSLFSNC